MSKERIKIYINFFLATFLSIFISTSSIFAADVVADFKDLECRLRAAEGGFSGDGYCKGLPLDEFYLEVTDGENRYGTRHSSKVTIKNATVFGFDTVNFGDEWLFLIGKKADRITRIQCHQTTKNEKKLILKFKKKGKVLENTTVTGTFYLSLIGKPGKILLKNCVIDGV